MSPKKRRRALEANTEGVGHEPIAFVMAKGQPPNKEIQLYENFSLEPRIVATFRGQFQMKTSNDP